MTRRENLWSWLVGVNVFALIVSNLLAVKLTNFFGIAVDCGILLYPITYVAGDITVEFFGKTKANRVICISFVLNAIATAYLSLAAVLPAYPSWDGQEHFGFVFGFMPRVVLGSLVAYCVAGVLNNSVFERLRGQHNFAARALGSSVVARIADTVIFETIAFAGVLSFGEFLQQAVFAYLAGIVVESLLFCFVTAPLSRLLRKYLNEAPAK